MARSIASAAASVGVGPPEVGRVLEAFRTAMEPRTRLLDDDHHPAYLHPGRSILILIQDVRCDDAEALAMAASIESEDPWLAPSAESMSARPGGCTPHPVPSPGDEALLERLVGLPHGAALAALAERLDHLRHYHVRPDLRPLWHPRYDEVVEAWQPFAHRVDAGLARRYDHWVRTFGRRLR